MGFFDKLKDTAAVHSTSAKPEQRTESITFTDIPETMEAFTSLPSAHLATPYDTAALTVAALCVYPANRELSLQMLDFLRGPRPMSEFDKQFIRDRFMDKDYVPRSYFNGAVPGNDYMPSSLYTVTVSSNPYSFDQEGMAKLFLTSGGADSPRQVSLRLANDGKWYLWEQFLLSDIRKPESENPWA
ncbi:MAG: hypothetical protein K5756_10115 [Clostridiales bacterium]|nr:hypothetical protein [Clostridiales bacterium]